MLGTVDDARELLRHARYEEAVAVCDALVAASGANDAVVADGLWVKCEALSHLGRHVEEAEVASAIADRFREAQEPALRIRVGEALFVACWGLMADARSRALALADQLRSRYAEESGGAVVADLTGVLLDMGDGLIWEDEFELALSMYEAVLRSEEIAQASEARARALIGSGMALTRAGHRDEAQERIEAAYELGVTGARAWREFAQKADGVIDRSGSRAIAASAFLGEAVAYGRSEQLEDATAAVTGVIGRFGDDPDPQVAAVVALAEQAQEELQAAATRREE